MKPQTRTAKKPVIIEKRRAATSSPVVLEKESVNSLLERNSELNQKTAGLIGEIEGGLIKHLEYYLSEQGQEELAKQPESIQEKIRLLNKMAETNVCKLDEILNFLSRTL